MASLFERPHGQVLELERQLGQFCPNSVFERMLKEPGFAPLFFEEATSHTSETQKMLVNKVFVDPVTQIENMRRWNKELRWRFTEHHFKDLRLAVQPKEDNGATAVVLVPYFETVRQTIINIIPALRLEHPALWVDEKTVAFCQGRDVFVPQWDVVKKPRLVWETIRFSSMHWKPNSETIPNEPHAGVFAAAAHFPLWARLIGTHIPQVRVPGFPVNERNSAFFVLRYWYPALKISVLYEPTGYETVTPAFA